MHNEKHDRNTELFQKIRTGDEEAREQMILENIPLVVSIAIRTKQKTRSPRIDLEEMINEGVIGLIGAIEHYNPEGNPDSRFSTFAHKYISKRINRFCSIHAGAWTLPPGVADCIRKAAKNRATESERRIAEYGRAAAQATRVLSEIPDVAQPDYSRHFNPSAFLGLLDEKYSLPIQMSFGISPFSKTSVQRISQSLGLSRRQVRQRIHDGLSILNRMITVHLEELA